MGNGFSPWETVLLRGKPFPVLPYPFDPIVQTLKTFPESLLLFGKAIARRALPTLSLTEMRDQASTTAEKI